VSAKEQNMYIEERRPELENIGFVAPMFINEQEQKFAEERARANYKKGAIKSLFTGLIFAGTLVAGHVGFDENNQEVQTTYDSEGTPRQELATSTKGLIAGGIAFTGVFATLGMGIGAYRSIKRGNDHKDGRLTNTYPESVRHPDNGPGVDI
jgi:hypothetical protein